jgi:cation diffusion facilitator CzcD-associated flavoprotein CzcO
VEHLDVLVVGAGLSGIAAAHHLRTRCPWATFAVVEARDAIGGTWDLFRYPGIRSDSDMHTLGFSFRPWDGAESIADGDDILRYLRETAAAEGIDRRIRFGLRVTHASWSTAEARWHVTLERSAPPGGTNGGDPGTVRLTCGFLFSCTGYYRYDRGHAPEFPGLADYAGRVVHPQFWPEDLDVAGKRVVVIGSGATAITLIPALAGDAEHVTMLQRSPSYIASLPSRSPASRVLRRVVPHRWAEPATRWVHALTTQAFFQLSRRRPAMVRRMLRKGAQAKLPEGYDVDTHFSPRYDPWDQRLCVAPGGDLFDAIAAGDASVVTDTIETFTERGIRLASGTELEADIVVTATGLDLLFLGGMRLEVDGEPVDPGGRLAYKGAMVEGVPNLALAFGYTNASWTLKAELTCDFVCRLLNHLRTAGLRQATPRDPGPGIERSPLLGLTSGYVTRSAHLFPQQGSTFPWQVHQSYLKDYRAMKRRPVVDQGLVLDNPVPAAEARPVAGVAATDPR